jgi:Flp pilus assembly pilin Flp
MKLFVKMQAAFAQLKNKKGQNTVEYLLMLVVIVGVALAVGMAIKKFMPELFSKISGMISGATDQLGTN